MSQNVRVAGHLVVATNGQISERDFAEMRNKFANLAREDSINLEQISLEPNGQEINFAVTIHAQTWSEAGNRVDKIMYNAFPMANDGNTNGVLLQEDGIAYSSAG